MMPACGGFFHPLRPAPDVRTGVTLSAMSDPLALILLPEKLERFAAREHAEGLLRAPGVLAVDPPRVAYGALSRLPLALGIGIAERQAKRLLRALPGTPRAVIVYGPGQVALGLAVVGRAGEEAELWYAECEPGGRHAELHAIAEARAALRFGVRSHNRPLMERLEALGVESGRLGSERLRLD